MQWIDINYIGNPVNKYPLSNPLDKYQFSNPVDKY